MEIFKISPQKPAHTNTGQLSTGSDDTYSKIPIKRPLKIKTMFAIKTTRN